MSKRKRTHAISREETEVLLTRRIEHAVDEITWMQAAKVAEFLLGSKLVTPDTMFGEDPVKPRDHGAIP